MFNLIMSLYCYLKDDENTAILCMVIYKSITSGLPLWLWYQIKLWKIKSYMESEHTEKFIARMKCRERVANCFYMLYALPLITFLALTILFGSVVEEEALVANFESKPSLRLKYQITYSIFFA